METPKAVGLIITINIIFSIFSALSEEWSAILAGNIFPELCLRSRRPVNKKKRRNLLFIFWLPLLGSETDLITKNEKKTWPNVVEQPLHFVRKSLISGFAGYHISLLHVHSGCQQ